MAPQVIGALPHDAKQRNFGPSEAQSPSDEQVFEQAFCDPSSQPPSGENVASERHERPELQSLSTLQSVDAGPELEELHAATTSAVTTKDPKNRRLMKPSLAMAMPALLNARSRGASPRKMERKPGACSACSMCCRNDNASIENSELQFAKRPYFPSLDMPHGPGRKRVPL